MIRALVDEQVANRGAHVVNLFHKKRKKRTEYELDYNNIQNFYPTETAQKIVTRELVIPSFFFRNL